MIKLCIFGDRDVYPSFEMIDRALSSYYALDDHINPTSIEVVCGMAPGADTCGLKWAECHGLLVSKFYAQWHLGRSAAIARNELMAKYATHGIGFWDGKSRGTAYMAALLLSAGKPVKLVKCLAGPRIALDKNVGSTSHEETYKLGNLTRTVVRTNDTRQIEPLEVISSDSDDMPEWMHSR
jgi:hypothetical protein